MPCTGASTSSKQVPQSLKAKCHSPRGSLLIESGITNVVQVNGKGICLETDYSEVFKAFLEIQTDNHLFMGPQVCFHHFTADENGLPIIMWEGLFL